MYVVEPYIRPNGSCPFEEYIQGLLRNGDKTGAVKVQAAADWLGNLGLQDMMRLRKAEVMNDVSQLRPVPHRIFFFWDGSARKYILLHGFRKKSNQTPRRELRHAENLRDEYFRRKG